MTMDTKVESAEASPAGLVLVIVSRATPCVAAVASWLNPQLTSATASASREDNPSKLVTFRDVG